MHGEGRYYMDPKGHIVLGKYPGEWEATPSYIEEPEAAACKWVSIRERNRAQIRPTEGIFDPDLHPSRDRLAARHLRWQLSYGDVHRRRGRLSEMDGAQELEATRYHRRRPYGRGTLATCSVIFRWEEVQLWSQCRTDGEINVPLHQGLIKEQDIAGEIGEIITGRKPGRVSDVEITLFDSTGIALQDSAAVPLEYERAVAAGVGVEKKMIST